MSKGSVYRSCNKRKFDSNFDQIDFGKGGSVGKMDYVEPVGSKHDLCVFDELDEKDCEFVKVDVLGCEKLKPVKE